MSLQDLTDHPEKYGFISVRKVSPDAIEEQLLTIPIELADAPAPLLAECRYITTYAEGSWACKVTGLPFMGVGSAPLEAHQYCENALKAYVVEYYEKNGWEKVSMLKGKCLTIKKTSEAELRETPESILFPCAVALRA